MHLRVNLICASVAIYTTVTRELIFISKSQENQCALSIRQTVPSWVFLIGKVVILTDKHALNKNSGLPFVEPGRDQSFEI